MASILDSRGGAVASDYEFYPEAVRPEDQAFIVWAANNAPKLAERVAALEAALREAQGALADNALSQEHGGNGISPEYFASVRATISKALEAK